MSDLVTIYVPVPSKEIALDLSRTLVTERLIACANIMGPGTSVYQWAHQVQEDVEWYLFLKTTQSLVSHVMERTKALHPYECPAITVWNHTQTDSDYMAWVKKTLVND